MRLHQWLVVLSLLLCALDAQAVDVQLTWTANTEADLAGYKFYHAAGTCPAGPLPPLLVNGQHVTLPKTATQYQHIGPAVSGQWCYELTAFDTSGNESARSNRASKTMDLTAPAAPTLRLGSPGTAVR
jgi:hypothetical protein